MITILILGLILLILGACNFTYKWGKGLIYIISTRDIKIYELGLTSKEGIRR